MKEGSCGRYGWGREGLLVPGRPLSEEQRSAIRAAVRELAVGGYDSWRIADVVERTGVSSRTLYKYFPSKEYLLLESLLEQAGDVVEEAHAAALDRRRPPSARVEQALAGLTVQFTATPDMARSLVRALLSGQDSVAPVLRSFNDTLCEVVQLALAGEPGAADARQKAQAETIQQVWFAALVAWACTVEDAAHVGRAVHRVLELLDVAQG